MKAVCHASHGAFLLRHWAADRYERVDLDLVGHAPMNLHKFLDAETFERRHNRLQLLLDEYGIEPILITNRFEDVQLDE